MQNQNPSFRQKSRLRADRFSVVMGAMSIALLIGLQACSTDNSNAASEVASAADQVAVVETATQPETTTETGTTEPDTTAVELPTMTIAAIAKDEPTFATFTQALASTDLLAKLDQEGTYTVFAPADEAFADLPPGQLEQLLKPENKDQLVKLLSYHIVPEQLQAEDLQPGELNTLAGLPLTISSKEKSDTVRVNEASVIIPDVQASNGTIHIIDRVILPPQ
jgi:uncharacterized surface protein with fasciclin (FAS1) repeats